LDTDCTNERKYNKDVLEWLAVSKRCRRKPLKGG